MGCPAMVLPVYFERIVSREYTVASPARPRIYVALFCIGSLRKTEPLASRFYVNICVCLCYMVIADT